MINQKAISAKIDLHIYQELEDEAKIYWKSRNRIINDAIHMYCEARKLQRIMRDKGRGIDYARTTAAQFLKDYVAPDAHVYVDMIDL